MLALKYPQISAARTISLTGALVDQVISKSNDSRIADEIGLVIMVMELVNFGVLAKISKASEKLLAPMTSPGKVRKDDHYVWIHHLRKRFHLPIMTYAVGRLNF
jgi:hypothetical protein